MTDGQVTFPLVIRSGNGGGLRFGAQHSQSVENWAMAIPGLKVVAPSNAGGRHRPVRGSRARSRPGDVLRAQGPLRHEGRGAGRRDRRHARHREGAAAGRRRTILALAAMVPRALEAAERLAESGHRDATVVDVRSLVPLDTQTILREVQQDRAAVHGRGEPAAVRLGRRDRVHRRPRRASGPSTGRSCGSPPHTSRCPSADALEDLAIPFGRADRRDDREGAAVMTTSVTIDVPRRHQGAGDVALRMLGRLTDGLFNGGDGGRTAARSRCSIRPPATSWPRWPTAPSRTGSRPSTPRTPRCPAGRRPRPGRGARSCAAPSS